MSREDVYLGTMLGVAIGFLGCYIIFLTDPSLLEPVGKVSDTLQGIVIGMAFAAFVALSVIMAEVEL